MSDESNNVTPMSSTPFDQFKQTGKLPDQIFAMLAPMDPNIYVLSDQSKHRALSSARQRFHDLAAGPVSEARPFAVGDLILVRRRNKKNQPFIGPGFIHCDDGDTLSYEEYLRDIWKQLNVGHDGYLTVDELYRVCEHIGMNISNDQIIEQLFDRLDSDQDGRVSLTEFVDGLFQYIHHQSDSNHQNISSSSVPESLNHHQSYNYQSTITNEISSSPPSIDDNRIQMNSIVPSSHAIVSHYQLLPPPPSSSSTILFNLLSTYSNFLTIKSDKDGNNEIANNLDANVKQCQHDCMIVPNADRLRLSYEARRKAR
ncbi:hypothetical protein DERP_002499 [Dermatophagoides pteronyssinus]|uniref:EF-hand domain-containing protein n=1 Tax=Dermatophagoides pteronyssinus TaxID=6956 RepID=A0ABQ8JHX6_DERPT|nr:hypothetical protein DERP_002499 [Dermatophagoides pteronyssinus]